MSGKDQKQELRRKKKVENRSCRDCKKPISPELWSEPKYGISQYGKTKGKQSITRTAICAHCGNKNFSYEYKRLPKKNGRLKDFDIRILSRHCKKCGKGISKSYWHMRESVVVKGRHAGDKCFLISAVCPHCKTKNAHHRYQWYPDWSHATVKPENEQKAKRTIKKYNVAVTFEEKVELTDSEKLATTVLAKKFDITDEELINRITKPWMTKEHIVKIAEKLSQILE